MNATAVGELAASPCRPGWYFVSEDGEVAPYRCRSWDCPECGPRRRRWFIAQCAYWSRRLGLRRFVTLTLDPSELSGDREEWVRYLRAVWRRWRVVLSRFVGRSVSFIAVVEFHRSGVPHLHVLVDVYLPQRWISRSWSSVGGGRIVDVRFVDVQRVSAYLSKYLSKSLSGFPRGLRRYSTSRDIRFEWRRPSGVRWCLWRIGWSGPMDTVIEWIQNRVCVSHVRGTGLDSDTS